jgi:coenzyme F420-reducing hydrogenase beta subunit
MSVDVTINQPSLYGCCGCGVCVVVCPEKCIQLEMDQDGYYIGRADLEQCSGCGLCPKVCFKFQDKYALPYNTKPAVYTGYHRDDDIRYISSSGGIATAIGEAAIAQGYKVIGAALNLKSRRLEHQVISTAEDLQLIRGSKYIPSYTPKAFSYLKENPKCVVVGTPCQIGGLRRMIQMKDELSDVILVDFRCFGHAGKNLFEKYVDFLEGLNTSGIKSINMRAKNKGWHMWGVQADFNDGNQYYQNKFRDPFTFCFRSGQAVHDVCINCHEYKNSSHADLRMEDAWAFVSTATKMDLKTGLSMISVYSDKGKRLFEMITDTIAFKKEQIDVSQRTYTVIHKKHYLMELLRTDLSLKRIVKEYKNSLSTLYMINWNLQSLITTIQPHVPGLYNFARRIYRKYFVSSPR